MLIGIITYNRYHLKTHEVIKNLLKKNYEIILIITPFKVFKSRKVIFQHRPNQFKFVIENNYLDNNKFKKIKIEEIYKYKFYKILVTGSGLIHNKYIKKNKILNCHSGLIPQNRGLDSFKWAI